MPALGVPVKGRIAAEEQAEQGRAVARFTDLGWGTQVRELFAPGTPDGEVPVPLRHAVVAVLDAWHFAAGRPDGIVAIGGRTRPQLVAHLADGLARYTGLPLLGRFDVTGSAAPGQGAMNSPQRLRAVADRYTLSDPSAVAGRTVLLLDDRADTGWTLTVAARQLRLAGALAVYPLVLATS
jgi:ATP-dependent DNA helicase RecQ